MPKIFLPVCLETKKKKKIKMKLRHPPASHLFSARLALVGIRPKNYHLYHSVYVIYKME